LGGDEKRYKGHIDVPLSDEGIAQIERLAVHIKERTDGNARWGVMKGTSAGYDEQSGVIRSVYTSDLSRAIRSAEIIAAPFGLEPVQVAAFRERSFGEWEGMSFDEIRSSYPDDFNAWAGNPVKFSPRGGESTEAVRDRVMPGFGEVLSKHGGEKIAIVAHGGITRIILCEVLSIPLQNIFRIEQNFGCMNVIEFYDDMPVVKVMNFVA